MDRFEEINSFIEKAAKFTVRQAEQNEYEEYLKRKKYNESQRHLPKTKIAKEKYEKSEKGRRMRKRRSLLKNTEEIKSFYRNRPSGYVVDHIIPLALEGDHILENLQYLSRLENERKPRNKITTNDKVAILRNRFIRKL